MFLELQPHERLFRRYKLVALRGLTRGLDGNRNSMSNSFRHLLAPKNDHAVGGLHEVESS